METQQKELQQKTVEQGIGTEIESNVDIDDGKRRSYYRSYRKLKRETVSQQKKQSLKKKDRERKAKAKPQSKTPTKMLSKASPYIVSPKIHML